MRWLDGDIDRRRAVLHGTDNDKTDIRMKILDRDKTVQALDNDNS